MDRSIIAVSRLTLILFTLAASAFAEIPGLTELSSGERHVPAECLDRIVTAR